MGSTQLSDRDPVGCGESIRFVTPIVDDHNTGANHTSSSLMLNPMSNIRIRSLKEEIIVLRQELNVPRSASSIFSIILSSPTNRNTIREYLVQRPFSSKSTKNMSTDVLGNVMNDSKSSSNNSTYGQDNNSSSLELFSIISLNSKKIHEILRLAVSAMRHRHVHSISCIHRRFGLEEGLSKSRLLM